VAAAEVVPSYVFVLVRAVMVSDALLMTPVEFVTVETV
jgi:hypothetical protein